MKKVTGTYTVLISEIIYLDECFIPGMILALESKPLLFKIFFLVSLIIVFLVLVDKKVMFRNVLFIEHILRHRKYSRYLIINIAA